MRRFLLLVLCLILIAGSAVAEPIKLEVVFPATEKSRPITQSVMLDDHWFDAPSSIYNHQLTRLSACMMVSAFRDRLAPLAKSDHYLTGFFSAAGFEGYQPCGYETEPGAYTISNGIAMKRLADDRGEYVLIAVPVCGQGYGDEWMSNFTVDDGDSHEGFYASAEMVYHRLKDYIAAHGLEGRRVKVWGMGFSRAAAVSNVLGHLLLTDDAFEADDIFIYTFGTPNTTRLPVAHPQIFNICGSFDPVPKIPFADWGFGKHGVTLYLPSRETRAQYVRQQETAAGVYGALVGSAEDFPALMERNWLIGRLLEMIYNFLPESTIYSDEYQAAVVAAWGDKGSFLDKLHTMIRTLEEQHADTTGVTRLRDELAAIMSIGVTDTVDMLEGFGGSGIWFDLLSSGKKLVHEHFPEKYISWVFSTDDSEMLLTEEPRYTRVVVFGDVDVKIVADDQVLMDQSGGEAAVARIRNQQVISLPAGQAYQITVTAARNTSCSIGYNTASVKYVSLPLQTTDVMTLYRGETISIHVPDCLDPNGAWSIRLNGRQQLAAHDAAARISYMEMLMAGSASTMEQMRYKVNSAVIMLPWIICGAVLVLYAMAVFIKRLAIRRMDDHTKCKPVGKGVLILTAILSAVLAALVLTIMAFTIRISEPSTLTNKTLQRASEFLGISSHAYQGSTMVIYACMAVLSIRAIRHAFSRIHLTRLYCVVLLMDVMTLLLGFVLKTLNEIDLQLTLIPILGLLGVFFATDRNDPRHMLGKRWLPVSRTIVFTALVFLLRQGYVYFFGTQTLLAVSMKALSGLPVLLLALFVWHRGHTDLHGKMLIALNCYFAANTVINLSMPAALALYTVGHAFLIAAFIRSAGFGKLRLAAWVLIAALFECELFFFQNQLELPSKAAAFVYIIAIAGVAVNGAGVSRRMLTGVALFLISNQILSFTLVFPGDFLLESVELLLYYVAVIVMVSDPDAMTDHKPVYPDCVQSA